MRVYYLASDPRIHLAAATGYGSHIRKTIAAFKHQGFEVITGIAGDLQDISRSRALYRKVPSTKSSAVRFGKSVARDLHEILDDFLSYRRYRNALRQTPCDFIYERMAPFRTSGARLAKEFRIPLVLEINDPSEEVFHHYPSALQRYGHSCERTLLKTSSGIVVGSRKLKDYYINRTVRSSKLQVVYPTADYSLFTPEVQPHGGAPSGASPGHVRVGFVGNIRPWHGADLLLRAFARISRREHLELVIVGDGPGLGGLQELAVGLDLSSQVKFTGAVKYETVPGLMRTFDICVIPNATWYGSPTKLFEYGAMAKAVVAPRETPADEVIEDGVNGLLIKPGRVDQLASAIESLSHDSQKRQQLGRAFRQRLINEITWPKNVALILDLLRDNGVSLRASNESLEGNDLVLQP